MRKISFRTGRTGFVAVAAFLLTLTGCMGYAHEPSSTIEAHDDYFYYPDYGVYYSNHRHQYLYLDRDTWVWRPAPVGVSEELLHASPSVKMDFHDAPARHHAEVVRRYPKNWTPPEAHASRLDPGMEDGRDGSGDQHEK